MSSPPPTLLSSFPSERTGSGAGAWDGLADSFISGASECRWLSVGLGPLPTGLAHSDDGKQLKVETHLLAGIVCASQELCDRGVSHPLIWALVVLLLYRVYF